MKHLFLLLLTLTATASSYAQTRTAPQLSPQTQLYLAKKDAIQPGYVYKRINGELYLSALIKTSPGFSEAALQQIGVLTGTHAGNILTVQIPLTQVKAFSQLSGIDYLQLDEPVYPALDSARKTTLVDTVHSGQGLPRAYSGAGVVMGVIDVGFDYTHPTFLDTGGTRFRIKKVWEQKTAGTPPAGYAYGAEYTDSTAIRAHGTDIASQTHGTHVAGIAAGSGFGTAGRFRGVAYASDIVMVGITPPKEQWMNTGLSDIIDGMAYVFSYAASVGKPAVANLSWGCTVGSHDGLSLFSQACDNLTGAGKLFSISAGNNGGSSVHLQKTFTAADTLGKVAINVASTPIGRRTWVDAWGEAGQTYCVALEGSNSGAVCTQQNGVYHLVQQIGGGDSIVADVVTTTAAYNGRPRIFISISNYSVSSDAVLRFRGTGGTLHAWNGYVHESTGYYSSMTPSGVFPVTVDDALTTGDMASTKSALTVAAYAARNSFQNINGSTVGFQSIAARGNIASFSSKGPTLDGRSKPDIAAPGVCVASAFSSFDNDFRPGGGAYSYVISSWQDPVTAKKFYYGGLNGTSMASPVAAGILALLLEAKPGLRPDSVKVVLAATAIRDNFTGALAAPSPVWGTGKINAHAAIKRALQWTGLAPTGLQQLDCSILPNPSGGRCRVRYSGSAADRLTIALYNAEGRLVYSAPWAVTAGLQEKEFDFSMLGSGIYIAHISGSRGRTALKITIR